MDWATMGLGLATALISVGTLIMKIKQTESNLKEFKDEFIVHRDRDNIRFDDHTQRINDQEVAHQAIHTSLQFIMQKLDKIEEGIFREN